MEILGIGPGEFILILIILLVVVGPERLPDLARQAGRLLVRGRNWLQSSPDAAMVMRARQEIEQELATLRTSLLEVQSVRDEVLGAAKQIGAEVNSLTSATKAELEELGKIAPSKPANPLQEMETTLANAPGQPGAEDQASLEQPPAEPAEQAAQAAGTTAAPEGADEQAPQAPSEPDQPPPLAEQPPAEPAPAAQAVFESIDLRLQAIMTDLFALQEQLIQRGVLADDWRPPSWNMQLPGDLRADHPAPPATDEAVETEEAPNVQ
jgi:sec-independent protein translocase protein TatB